MSSTNDQITSVAPPLRAEVEQWLQAEHSLCVNGICQRAALLRRVLDFLTAAEREIAALRQTLAGSQEVCGAQLAEAREACRVGRERYLAELAVLREENQRLEERRFALVRALKGVLDSAFPSADNPAMKTAWKNARTVLDQPEDKRAESAEARVTALEAALKDAKDALDGCVSVMSGWDVTEGDRVIVAGSSSQFEADFNNAIAAHRKALAALTGKEDAPNG